MEQSENVPREERGSQAMIAAYLRTAYTKRVDSGGKLRVGPTDLDRIAMMLARSYSSGRVLSLSRMRDDFADFMRVFESAVVAVENDLSDIRALNNDVIEVGETP